MAEGGVRPITFSGLMIRALLDGRKTQTRRLLKPQPFIDAMGNFCAPDPKGKVWNWGQHTDGRPCVRNYMAKHVPFAAGDRAYVREAWRVHKSFDAMSGGELEALAPRVWPELDRDNCDAHGRYRHGRFMPRWASRLTLLVEAVRVQPLQDISEADAIAEGISEQPCEGPHRGPDATYWTAERGSKDYLGRTTPIAAYGALWDSLHTDPGTRWEDNPWIYALTFRVKRGNVDHLETCP